MNLLAASQTRLYLLTLSAALAVTMLLSIGSYALPAAMPGLAVGTLGVTGHHHYHTPGVHLNVTEQLEGPHDVQGYSVEQALQVMNEHVDRINSQGPPAVPFTNDAADSTELVKDGRDTTLETRKIKWNRVFAKIGLCAGCIGCLGNGGVSCGDICHDCIHH